jgi:predicted  nucleic acid-binding Zn-ribbon protein
MTLMQSVLHLYQLDSQVRGLRSRLDGAQRYADAQSRQLEHLLQQRNEIESRRRLTQATVANQETEIASIDQRIEKLRDELNSAATNKQYTALLNELNTAKEQRDTIEARAMDEMEAIETLAGQMTEVEDQILERRKVLDVARQQVEERRQEVGQRLEELEAERAQVASTIDSESLAVFEEIANAYDGEAMGHIEEVDRRHREFACGACHMSLPFEQVSLLMSGHDTLVRCNACGRILYMQDETRGALAKK